VLNVEIKGAPGADRIALGFSEWARTLKDFKPAFQDVRHIFNRHQKLHFASDGASTGKPWPSNWEPAVPWLPPDFKPRFYPSWKKATVGHTKTLRFTGKLEAAATGGQGALKSETPTYMEMGVNEARVPYASDHHFGRKVSSQLFRREVQLKKRPVVRFNGSVLGTSGSAFDKQGRTSFGFAVRQVFQAHIVRARRLSFGFDTDAADATIARLRNTDTK